MRKCLSATGHMQHFILRLLTEILRLEPWIITAGLSVQISNCKNYMGMETRLYCATRAHCIACPPKITESKWAVLPPMLHSIPQGNHAASGQCWELGYDRAGHRCSVSLPQASLFGSSLVWTFLDCSMCRDMFFSGLVGCVCCSMFVWTFTRIADEMGNVFVCMRYSHTSSIQKYSSTCFFSQSSMLTVFQRIFQNILAQTKRSCLQDP